MLAKTFLMALALCVDSLVVSTAVSLKWHIGWRKGLTLASLFAFFQGGLPIVGALAGSSFKQYVEQIDHWIAFALLLAVGGHMIWDSFRKRDDSRDWPVLSLWLMITLAVATSIDALVVGIGFGLELMWGDTFLSSAIIAATTFIVSLAGIALGRNGISMPEKWSSIVAGATLIALGTHTLIEHLL